MFDLLRRHVVILTSVVMGWSAYTFHDAGDGKAAALAKASMADIAPEFLALRDASLPLEIASDPYRLDVQLDESGQPLQDAAAAPGRPAAHAATAEAGARPAPAGKPVSQADLLLAFSGALRAVAQETHELFASPDPVAAPAVPAVPGAAAATPARRGFTLVLQSTLDMATGGQARINGRTVAEGETMPFLDPLDPPLLRQVRGTAVIVSYGDELYVADLLESPLLQVGDPAVAAAVAAASQASGKPAPKAASSGAPAPATSGAKPKGTYRVRGSSTKKKP